jgi:dCMP deaminase
MEPIVFRNIETEEIKNARPTKHENYLDIAEVVSKRGTCLRRNYGAVIVNQGRIVSTGYTGAPRGVHNCCDTGRCLRNELKIPSGQQYEKCMSAHAEMNAITHATYSHLIEADLYLIGIEKSDGLRSKFNESCAICKRLIINAQIKREILWDPVLHKPIFINVHDWIDNPSILQV